MLLNEAFAGTLPITGTEVAARWDSLYTFLLWLSAFFFVLVVGGMLYFLVTYRHVPGRKTQYIKGNHLLEFAWVSIPTILLLVIFVWGYSIYHQMVQAPGDAYEVRVIGKQWMWTFQYDNGQTSVGEVYVPMNRPVKFILTSEDVLHGFFVPSFRVKQDAVPGMYSSIWFTATVPGKHQVFCTEYCGTSHSEMLAQVIVLDDEQWKDWNRNKKPKDIPVAGQMTLAEQGKNLYRQKGCIACHNTDDDTVKLGPSHKGLYGRRTELADGRTIIADENYIRTHIENPQTNTVKGFKPVMPTFKGLISESEMNAILAYIKSLK